MDLMNKWFAKGDRVRLSERGAKVITRVGDREGTVVGFCLDGTSVWVLWDGYRSRSAYHVLYLERVGIGGGA